MLAEERPVVPDEDAFSDALLTLERGCDLRLQAGILDAECEEVEEILEMLADAGADVVAEMVEVESAPPFRLSVCVRRDREPAPEIEVLRSADARRRRELDGLVFATIPVVEQDVEFRGEDGLVLFALELGFLRID